MNEWYEYERFFKDFEVEENTDMAVVLQVMIQGNHVAYAVKLLLEEYKINKKYIKGVENAGKPKKKK